MRSGCVYVGFGNVLSLFSLTATLCEGGINYRHTVRRRNVVTTLPTRRQKSLTYALYEGGRSERASGYRLRTKRRYVDFFDSVEREGKRYRPLRGAGV